MTRRKVALLGVITLLGAGVRLTSPGRIGLWRDEVQALNIAALPSVAEITRFLYAHESHPPLFYFVEHALGRLTGDAAAAIGVLVLVAGIALIPAVWWLASLSGVRGAAPIAAALVAISVPLSFFSVQLRPYALVSLAMVIGTAAILRDRVAPSPRWRILWGGMALVLMYLHHVGVMIVTAQLVTASVLVRPAGPWRKLIWTWVPVALLVALGAVPDLVMLAHQGAVAAYPVRHPIEVWQPFRELWGLGIAFPGEIGLALLGATVGSLSGAWRTGPGFAEQPAPGRTDFPAMQFVTLMALLVVASFRSNLLVPYVVMSVAPLGLVAAGIVIARAVSRPSPWRRVLVAELTVACVAFSTLAFVGNGKTDTDLVARYVAAEARPNDLVIVVPGALGPSFNRAFRGTQSQIDFPVVGAVRRYEFDHDFERVASRPALQATLDSIAAACRTGRQVWLITPARWMLAAEPPLVFNRALHGGLGQADIARANLLERRVSRVFGHPIRLVRPSGDGAGVEHLEARLWAAVPSAAGATSGAACDVT